MKKEILAEGVELILGDCLEVLPTLGRFDAVVTDPPYGNANHNGDWNAKLNEHRGIENKPIANDDADGMRLVVDAMLRAVVPLMPKAASACCCFCGGGGGRVQCSLGLLNGWIETGWRFFIPLFGTNETQALASATAGSMRC